MLVPGIPDSPVSRDYPGRIRRHRECSSQWLRRPCPARQEAPGLFLATDTRPARLRSPLVGPIVLQPGTPLASMPGGVESPADQCGKGRATRRMSCQRQVARDRLRSDSWLRRAASDGCCESQYGQEGRYSASHSHKTQHGPRRSRKLTTICPQDGHRPTSPDTDSDRPTRRAVLGVIGGEPPDDKSTIQYQGTRTSRLVYILSVETSHYDNPNQKRL